MVEYDQAEQTQIKESEPLAENSVDGLVEYYVRWRHIPMDLMFTPMYLISIDHTKVKAKPNATNWDISKVIGEHFKDMNINYEDVSIESCQAM